MIRKAFYMEVKPDRIEEYTRAHNPIPEELAAIIRRHGVHNYSIFHHPGTNVMFGYMEIESEEEFARIGDYGRCHQWWKQMTENLVCATPGADKAKEEEMKEVFHLE